MECPSFSILTRQFLWFQRGSILIFKIACAAYYETTIRRSSQSFVSAMPSGANLNIRASASTISHSPLRAATNPFQWLLRVPITWCFVLAWLFSGVREPWIQRNKKIFTEWVAAAGSLIWYAKINFQLTTSNRNEDDSTLKIFINNFVHLRKKINNSMSINYATSNVNDARFRR